MRFTCFHVNVQDFIFHNISDTFQSDVTQEQEMAAYLPGIPDYTHRKMGQVYYIGSQIKQQKNQ